MQNKKTVFQKNIESLKNKALVLNILNHNISQNISLGNTNGYNLFIDQKPLHNTNSPLGEAKAIFEKCQNTPTSTTIIYGLGLGYLFQYAAQNSKGNVILYEPNLDILKTTFQLVDFSNELKNPTVSVTTTLEELNTAIRGFFNSDSYPETICLPSYKEIFKEQITKEATDIYTMIGGIAMDYSYTKNRFYHIACSVLNNIPALVDEPPLCSIKDLYKGKTAVVCSAGPTLAENIETLKKYKDNVIIISVGPAFRSLVKAGITPDFLCVIENKDCTGQIKGLDLSQTALVLEPYTHPKFHQRKNETKQTFSHISSNLPPNTIWKNLVDIDITEYASKGTVSYCALNTARILGCNKIVLVGQDLAFIGEQVYSKDSIYKDLKIRFNNELNKYEIFAEDFDSYSDALSQCVTKENRDIIAARRIANYNKKLVSVKGINGEMLPTEIVYTTFVSHISKFTNLHPEIEYINTSLKGALIKGFKNISLEEALKDSSQIEKSDFTNIEAFDKTKVIEKLTELKNSFHTAEDKISEIRRLLIRFKTETIRNKSLTKDMLITLKKVISAYSSLSINYAEKHQLFDFITKKEQMEFETFLQKAINIDYKAATKLAELQTEYLNATSLNIENVKNIIDNNIKILRGENEACSTKG